MRKLHEGKTAKRKMKFSPAPDFTPKEFREIRLISAMTRAVFAAGIGVAKRLWNPGKAAEAIRTAPRMHRAGGIEKSVER